MADITAQAALAADDIGKVEVPIPEWGGSLFIRELTAGAREEWERFCIAYWDTDTKEYNLKATLVAMTATNSKGDRIFSKEQVDSLNTKSCKIIDKLYAVARKVNEISQKDVDELIARFQQSQS